MKKVCLFALAAVSAAVANAQSNVVLYGLVDLNVSRYSPGSNVGGGSTTRMNDGHENGLNGSRWGLRVTEDLGADLKAGVVLESGILADTGRSGQGGRLFGRQSFISVTHASLGELRLGRQYVLSDLVMNQGIPFGIALVSNPGISVTNAGRDLPMWLNAPRADNVVQYQTPKFGGVALAAQVAPGEGTADRFHGFRAEYQSGPLFAGFAYEWNKSRSTGDVVNKSLTVAANYNFGVAKLVGGVQRNRDLDLASGNGAASGVSNLLLTTNAVFSVSKFDGATVGAEIPVGAATIGVNYTRMRYEGSGGEKANLGKIALTGVYNLSKNTVLYAGGSIATGDLKDYISEKRVLQVGMRKAF